MQDRLRSALIPAVASVAILFGCAAAHAQAITVSPSTLNLDNTTGSDVIRSVTLSTTSTTPITFSLPPHPNNSWLTISPSSGTVVAGGPVTLQFEANAYGLDTGNIYNVIVPISAGGQQVAQVQVYFNVQIVTGLSLNPAGVGWSYAVGGASPQPQPVTIGTSASTYSAQVSANAPWLELTIPNPPPQFQPQSALGGYLTSQGFILVFNSLGAGQLTGGQTYTGTVTVTDSNGNVSVLTVNLSVLVSSSAFTASQQSVTLVSNNGSSAGTTIQLSSTNPTQFLSSVTVITPPGVNWLSVSPQAGTAPQAVTITGNPAGLATGSYQGSVTFAAGSLSAVVQVTFVVTVPATTGGNIVSDRPSLSFGYVVGASAPGTQTINISDQAGSGAIPFTVSTQTQAGVAGWLSAAVSGGGSSGITGTSSAAVIVSVNPVGLAPGNYPGTINITPTGGSVVGIPVSLVVTGQSTVSASPLQLSFSYQTGNPAPAAQQIQVTGTAPSLPFTVVTATQSGGNWLSAGVTSGATPATAGAATPLSISVSPLQLGPGSYQGTVTVAGGTGATGTTTIQIFLTVTAALPSITSVVNAASFLSGPASPGEIITIFGTNIGPTAPVGLTLDSTGKVSTSLANTQVLFNGTPAPLTYVSATQINCVVPYEFANVTSGPYVQVKFGTQTSNAFPLQQSQTTPAIFTASNGTGQGAILNADNSYNGSGTGTSPAAKGSTVQVYMTGGGLLTPPQPTGSVTCSSGCASVSAIPKPSLAVAVLVNNQPANFTFAGEAPGFVSGVMQVDVTIPPNTPSGPVSITISVGGVSSQSGVTLQVQ